MPTNHTIRAVFFDMDGTLMDTAADLAYAFNQLLKQHNKSTLDASIIRELVSGGSKALIGRGFSLTPEDPYYDTLRNKFLSIYDEHIAEQTTLFPGASELLNFLVKKDIVWGIVTNKPAWLADELVDHFKLRSTCRCVVGYDTVNASKPKPDSLLHALKLTKMPAEQAIYIGDTNIDVIAAHAANMRAVAVTYGYADPNSNPHTWGADHVIDHLDELADWITCQ